MVSGSSSEQELEEWGLAEAGSSVQVRGAGGYKLSRVAPDQVAQRCTLLNSVAPDQVDQCYTLLSSVVPDQVAQCCTLLNSVVPNQVAQCCKRFQSCRVKRVLLTCACCTAVVQLTKAVVWYGMV